MSTCNNISNFNSAYIIASENIIEKLSLDDPDYVLLQSRIKNYKGNGVSIDKVIAQL
jgi:hypothetical protein